MEYMSNFAAALMVVVVTWSSISLVHSATSQCGSGQCLNNTVCCPGEKECCNNLDLCCGEHCCRDGYECCRGSSRCCKTASSCCGDSICCPDNYQCCPQKDHCCPSGYLCCENGNGCCPENYQCCGKYCCGRNTKCCPDGTGCYSDGYICCGNGLACREGAECCGNQCCPPGTTCCGDTCCNVVKKSTSNVALTISALFTEHASTAQPPYKQTTASTSVESEPFSGQTDSEHFSYTDHPQTERENNRISQTGISDDMTYLLFPIMAGVAVIIVVLICCIIVKRKETDVGETVKGYMKKMKEIVVHKK